MPIRPETFGYLPPPSNQQLEGQIQHALSQGWVPHLEFTDNPSSADFYWKNWRLTPARLDAVGKPQPITASQIVNHVDSCARRHPYAHIRFTAYNPKTRMTEMAFVCKTPQEGE